MTFFKTLDDMKLFLLFVFSAALQTRQENFDVMIWLLYIYIYVISWRFLSCGPDSEIHSL